MHNDTQLNLKQMMSKNSKQNIFAVEVIQLGLAVKSSSN